jgi:hypothetical protein
MPILRPKADHQVVRSVSPTKRDPSGPSTTQSSSRFGFKTVGGKRLSRMSMSLESKPAIVNTVAGTQATLSQQSGPLPTPHPSNVTARSAAVVDPVQRSATQPLPKTQGRLTRKWNFFQRAQTIPKPASTPVLAPAASLTPGPSGRSMAHYALLDGEQKKVDIDELERIMQEANESPDEDDKMLTEDDNASLDPGIELLPDEPTDQALDRGRPLHGHSMLLPERPFLTGPFEQSNRPVSPVVQLQRESPDRELQQQGRSGSPIVETILQSSIVPEPQTSPLVPLPPQRPSRLQQVGRIPHVKRDRERKLSVHSFSRPFGNEGSPAMQQQSPTFGSESSQFEDSAAQQRPPLSEMISQLREPSFAEEVNAALNLNRLSTATATTIDPVATDSAAEFFAFQPRKASEVSTSSSLGPPGSSSLFATSPPMPRISHAASAAEDEVWREYDDLIDDVLSQKQSRPSKTGRRPPALPLEAPSYAPQGLDANTQRTSDAMSSSSARNGLATRYLSSVPSVAAPNTPFSITDFVAAYGSRGASMASDDRISARMSLPPAAARNSGGSNKQSVRSSARPTSQPSSTQPGPPSYAATLSSRPTPEQVNTDTDDTSSCCSQSEEDPALESVANLRLGALMTSKWLSFGRVLFSPAHFELKDPRDDRVLIIDGLNKGQ